mgnify:CR=1 FL=1
MVVRILTKRRAEARTYSFGSASTLTSTTQAVRTLTGKLQSLITGGASPPVLAEFAELAELADTQGLQCLQEPAEPAMLAELAELQSLQSLRGWQGLQGRGG